ncbi:MAG: T9SS type A sorting domain-containing protein [Saprospiraceae bacterium]|nr:T9SS type A sorting domain-containing protein [Saprospiraceae bacterium]
MNTIINFVIAILILGSTCTLRAQWSPEISLNSGINEGYIWPRMSATSNGVYVIWGNSATDRIHGISVDKGIPGQQLILNQNTDRAFITGWASTEISAYQDKVAVVYKSENAQTGSSFIIFSEDGGKTFSAPRVAIDGNDILHRFPAIHIDDSGLYVSFMRFETNFLEPQYDLRHFDSPAVDSFEDVGISESVPGEVCDCCVSAITGNEDKVTVLFRNNDDNFRDIYAAVASKSQLKFNTLADLNAATWQIFSCPSTGADGMMSGDQLHAVFMSQHTGSQIVYLSSLNTIDGTVEVDRKLLKNSSLAFQNFPRMAGNGDTIGVVMQGAEGRNQNVYFTYSTTGTEGLGDTLMLLSTNSSGRQVNPDIAFQDGKFHMVWQDNSTALVMYRTFDPSGLTTQTVTPTIEKLSVYPNPVMDKLSVLTESNFSTYNVIDLQGNVVRSYEVGNTLNIADLESGLYILKVTDNKGSQSAIRFIKQ